MKNQQDIKHTGTAQGSTTADRAVNNYREVLKSKGISNGGGQRPDQTSNADNVRKRGR